MTWGAIFNRYKSIGVDPSDAAYRADQWEKRQHQDRWANCPSTHCERWNECRSPHDCCARIRPDAATLIDAGRTALEDKHG